MMGGLFRYDGWLMQTLSKLTDMILLSILWLVTSLPVVTCGAASAALYYSVHKVVRKGQGGVWRTYWHGFRQNFKQASLLWAVIAAVDVLMAACCWYGCGLYLAQNIHGVFFAFMIFVSALIVSWTCCLLPYGARFNASLGEILKNCVVLTLMHIFPLVLLAPVLVLCVLGAVFFPILLFVVPAVCAWLSGGILEGIFKKHMTEEALREDSQ